MGHCNGTECISLDASQVLDRLAVASFLSGIGYSIREDYALAGVIGEGVARELRAASRLRDELLVSLRFTDIEDTFLDIPHASPSIVAVVNLLLATAVCAMRLRSARRRRSHDVGAEHR